ncbi:MAG: insulinase family protein [Acidobacteriota bacterium]|nr:insulinase family protein [Acidobacteriota bacterium]
MRPIPAAVVALLAALVPAFPPALFAETPEVTTTILASGIPLHFQQDLSSSSTSVVLTTRGGKGAVPDGRDGLAYLVTRLAVDIPDERKARDMLSQAGRFSVSILEDGALIKIDCLSEYLEPTLKTAAAIIQDPIFSSIRIDRIKTMMTPQAGRQEDNSAVLAHQAVLEAFYGGRGYGGALYGNAPSLKSLDRKTVVGFYEEHFVSNRIFFSAVSDLPFERVSDLLEKSFTRVALGTRESADGFQDRAHGPENPNLEMVRETQQTYVGRAYPIPEFSLRSHVLALIGEALLGKGPGSRLWPLRVRDRLAYSVDAVYTPNRGGGVLIAYIETQNAKSGVAAAALDGELRRLREHGLTRDEFEAARMTARSHFLRGNESKESRAMTMAILEILGLKAGFFHSLPEELEAAALEDMVDFLRDVLDPERELRIVVGPVAAEPDETSVPPAAAPSP